jgi:hypothetical protein
VPAIGCFREREPGDPDPAFGQLPFELWQPFVGLRTAHPDLAADAPERRDGTWPYRGWTLTRYTVDDVQVTVLADPGTSSLGREVEASTRQVGATTWVGCDVGSPAQSVEFAAPEGPPVPDPDEVAAVAICEYSRVEGAAGLEASRRLTGKPAQDLTRGILDAPEGGGPDNPHQCADDMYGERAIALRFFGADDETENAIGEAFVYFDWCFGNGVVDASGMRRLTRENCAPLFATPPIALWSGHARTFQLCRTEEA